MPDNKNLPSTTSQLISLNKQLSQLAKGTALGCQYSIGSPCQFVVASLLSKNYKTHISTVLLCENGFGEDASILVRALFQSVVNLKFILKEDVDERVERFILYSAYLKKKSLDNILKLKEPGKVFSEDELVRIKQITGDAEVVNKRYDFRVSWSGKTIYEMAESVGMSGDYKIIYKFASGFAHSDVESLSHFFDKKNSTLLLGPGPELVLESLMAALEYFIIIADIWSDQLKLNLDQKLKKISDDAEKISEISNEHNVIK